MILTTTLLPSGSMPATSLWELLSFNSLAHVFTFAVQAFLLIVGLLKQYTFPWLRFFAIRISVFSCTMFGIFIELMQEFFIEGRYGDVLDVVSDTIGVLLGVVLFHVVYRPKL